MIPWPQYAIMFIGIFNLLIAIGKNGEQRIGKYSAGVSVASLILVWWVLWCGGFWVPILK